MFTAIAATVLTAVTVFAVDAVPHQKVSQVTTESHSAVTTDGEVNYEIKLEGEDIDLNGKKLNIKTDVDGNQYCELENGERVYLSITTTDGINMEGLNTDMVISAKE